MNLEQRIDLIQQNLEMNKYAAVAGECSRLIEQALRLMFFQNLTRLDEQDRLRVQQQELQI